MAEKEKRQYNRPRTIAIPADGRLQPQAIDLEEAVIGAILLEQDAYPIVSDILKPEYFYDSRHQKIYQAVVDLSIHEKPIDILTVTDQLQKAGQLEEVGGAVYLSQLSNKVASGSHIEYHARIIAQKHIARELISFTADVQGKAFDESIDVDDLMQEAEGNLFDISQHNIRKDVIQISPIITEALKNIEDAANKKEGISGIPSGYHGIDEITAGWQNSDLIIIAARPAMGKTAFVLSMAKNMAVDYKIPVGLFSLEMSNVQLVNRLMVNLSEIPGDKLRSGRLESFEWKQLHSQIAPLFDAPIYIDDTPSLSVFELHTKARRLVREHGVKCIFIDYLQLMNASGMNFGSREQEVSNISRSLKSLAKELNIPIIALSQLNRGVEARQGIEGKRPQLADLRESGAIEQDADMVCFIHRPEYYRITEDAKGNSLIGMAEIIIAKHRNGKTGDVILRFKSEFAKFLNPEDDIPVQTIPSKMNQMQDNDVPAEPITPPNKDFLAPDNSQVPY